MQETPVWFLGWEDPWRTGLGTHSSILGLPWWLTWWRICLQCGRPGFDPWVGKNPWRRAWQPTPVFLPGEFPWTEEPGELQSTELQRVRHNWWTKPTQTVRESNFESWLGNLSSTQKYKTDNAPAAAKSLQSCPTLCDPIDGSPPGSTVPGFSRQEHWSGFPFPSPWRQIISTYNSTLS